MPLVGDIKRGSELGYKGTKYCIWHACLDCGKERWVFLRKGIPENKRCKMCSAIEVSSRPDVIASRVKLTGAKGFHWKGGRHESNGYVFVYVDKNDFFHPMADHDNYAREHRLVMAKHLNRCLLSWEVVHHKNGIKNDNRLENLELLGSNEKHNKLLNKRIKELERQVALLEAENILLKRQEVTSICL